MHFASLALSYVVNKFIYRVLAYKNNHMKFIKIVPATVMLISALLMGCGNHKGTSTSSSDTGKANKTTADTAIVSGNQKSVPIDSMAGDPAAKGNSDPTAKLPK